MSLTQRRTLALTTASSLVALIAFVAPQATVTRTVADLGGGPSAVAWLLAAMPLGLAVSLLPAGAAGDDHGRLRVFTAGLALLGAGAAGCALAPGAGAFAVARLVQGAGGAGVLSCGLGLISSAFPPGSGRTHATGVWGASIGGGIATGGLLPVLCDPGGGWRASYTVVAVAALVLAVAAPVVVEDSAVVGHRGPDIAGSLVLGAGLVCVLTALVQLRTSGADAAVLGLGIAAVALMAAFAAVEARSAHPMLDLALFRRRDVLAATAGAVANGAGGTALVSYLPTVAQAGLGWSLLTASTSTLLFAGTSVLSALQVRRLPARVPAWALMAGSLLALAVGQVALAGLTLESEVGRLLPGLVLGGVAYGVLNAALGEAAVASAPPGRASAASGANNTARYLGSAVGITVVALLAPADPSAAGAVGALRLVQGWSTAAVVTAAVSVAGALVVTVLRPRT